MVIMIELFNMAEKQVGLLGSPIQRLGWLEVRAAHTHSMS
jgi:hypothetical protein